MKVFYFLYSFGIIVNEPILVNELSNHKYKYKCSAIFHTCDDKTVRPKIEFDVSYWWQQQLASSIILITLPIKKCASFKSTIYQNLMNYQRISDECTLIRLKIKRACKRHCSREEESKAKQKNWKENCGNFIRSSNGREPLFKC